ncbi:hypothetical protein IW261DRAFT_806388 [Armillaria novae-zelandiae]|uniref:Uncharacterized protein n=1 Tax=Armillaria novae-zelandiae TaxID=153914 RepID=A0AA39U1S2_9AGAR|nr:hypothetical protein IW261DRAFT_806388 [Armillaria novae-zelandiae]
MYILALSMLPWRPGFSHATRIRKQMKMTDTAERIENVVFFLNGPQLRTSHSPEGSEGHISSDLPSGISRPKAFWLLYPRCGRNNHREPSTIMSQLCSGCILVRSRHPSKDILKRVVLHIRSLGRLWHQWLFPGIHNIVTMLSRHEHEHDFDGYEKMREVYIEVIV